MPDDNEQPVQPPTPPRGSEKMRRRDDDDYASWQEAEEAYAEEEERHLMEQEAEERLNAIATMTDWFDTQFEPPENETPREDGEYFYIWGGPFEAGEVLHDQFGQEYDEEWISAAVHEVEKNGTYEWAPVTGGDYYEHPEPDDDDALTASAPLNRDAILAQIENLKSQLAELPTRSDRMGHNQPPEEIGAPPYDDEDKAEILDLLEDTEAEVSSDEPDAGKLKRWTTRLGEFALRAIKYAGSKGDLAINETIKWGVPIGGSYLVFGDHLQNLVAGIVRLFGL